MYWYTDWLQPKVVLIILAVLLLAALGAGAWLAREWRTFRHRRRLSRARRAEEDAPKVLEELGYEVLETQARGTMGVRVDGKAHETAVIADVLASKDGCRYVFEVKTGESAPDPLHPETRRQLLEYAIAFRPSPVMLLDMERGEAHRVEFPGLSAAPPPPPATKGLWKWLLLALLLGLLAGIGIGVKLV